jgi:hypothetical protein
MKPLFLLAAFFLLPSAFAEECKIEQVSHKCLIRVWPMSGGEDILRKEWEFEVPIHSGECSPRPYHYEEFEVPGTELSGELFISAEKYRMEFHGAERILIAGSEFAWTRGTKVSDLSGSYKGKFFTLMCGTTPWPW